MINIELSKRLSIVEKIIRRLKMYSYPILKFQKIDDQLIIFESFLGRNYNDSPRALYEYMKDRYPNMNYVWIVDKKSNLEIDGVQTVNRMSFRYFMCIAKAKYIVNNSRMPNFFEKRKEQVYLQTWHGTPLKKLVFDMEKNVMPGTSKEKYLKNFSNEVKNWSYLVSPNTYSTEMFKSAFRYEGEILEYGYPRNERLHKVTESERQKLRTKFGISQEDKVILYAPTYRDNNNKGRGQYDQDIKLDLELLDIQPNLKVLMRTHYLVSEKLDFEKYENIIDVSKEKDINDLFIVSDVLLNDYSSTMFDYLVLDKPLILFPYDLEEYKNDIRGFYMEYSDLPGEQIDDTNRLIEIVCNLKEYSNYWKEDLSSFKDKMILSEEANACKLVIDKLIDDK